MVIPRMETADIREIKVCFLREKRYLRATKRGNFIFS